MSARKILVTGGAGYIGSHACKALARHGYQPVVLDNLCRGHRWAVKWGPLEVGDIADADRVRQVLEAHRPSAILHFAGYGYVGESMTDPALYYDNNTVRGYRFLETVRAADITRRIIFSSSCSVYGVAPARPIAETAPLLPISTYGWSKLLFERMLADFHRAYGFESVSLRYFNAAGADPDGDLGEAHDPEPHILPLMLQAASRSEPRITLNGNDHETPDGFCVRDFVHVSDIAEAHVLALGRLLQNPPGPAVYNLGSGRGQSLKQLAGAVQRITGRTLELEIGPRRAGDPPFAVADSGLAERELGWKQHYSDLDSIVDSAWRWMSRTVSAAAGEVPSRDAPAKKQ